MAVLVLFASTCGMVMILSQDQSLGDPTPRSTVKDVPAEDNAARRLLRRRLDDDDDACQYVSVSGTTGQTSREGTYERVGECAARPYYECLDCSASDPQFLWYTGSQWFIGPGGCGTTVAA